MFTLGNLNNIFEKLYSIDYDDKIDYISFAKKGLHYDTIYPKQIEMVEWARDFKLDPLHIQNSQDYKSKYLKKQLLASKGTGKTDLITIADSCYKAYNDPTNYSCVIGCATENKGRLIMKGCIQVLEENNVKIKSASNMQIYLVGKIGKAPSINIITRTSKSLTGAHPTDLIFDDVIVSFDRFSQKDLWQGLIFYQSCIRELGVNKNNEFDSKVIVIGQLVTDNQEIDLHFRLKNDPNIDHKIMPIGSIPEVEKTLDDLRRDNDEYEIYTNYLLEIPKNIATFKVAGDFNNETMISNNLLIDNKRNIVFSFDFNVNPMTCVVAQVERNINNPNDNKYYVIDEFVANNTNIKDFSRLILNKYNYYKGTIIITGDASGQMRRVESTDNLSCYQQIDYEFKKAGKKAIFHLPSKNPRIMNRIRAFNNVCRNGNILISDTCKHLLYSLNNLYYKIGTSDIDDEINKHKVNDYELAKPHIYDAISYLTYSFNPHIMNDDDDWKNEYEYQKLGWGTKDHF
jgi:hypothetical protein